MRNTLITIFGTIMVPFLLHGLIPFLILQNTAQLTFHPVGILDVFLFALVGIGLCMVVWVAAVFVSRGKGTAVPLLPPTNFVAIGLYRYVRNPMYVGLLLVILVETIYFRSIWLLVYASVLWLGTHSYVVRVEEPGLEQRFGDSYKHYLATTPRWIPRPPRRMDS